MKKTTLNEGEQYTFLQLLNNYVNTYNRGDKTYTNGEELLNWKYDEETGYPTLDFNK